MALLMNINFYRPLVLSNAALWTTLLSALRNLNILLCVIAFLHTPVSAAADSPSAPKILVLGDSLSAAYGIQRDLGWVNLLRINLEKTYQGSVANASISGETTDGGLRSLPAHLKNHQPNIVIIELGANDGLRGFPITVIKNNLDQLIRISTTSGAEVVLVGIHIPTNYGPRYTEAFDKMYRDLAEEYELPFVPFLLKDVALNPELMQDDGLHPVAEAQPILLANVMSVLEGVLGAKVKVNPHASLVTE